MSGECDIECESIVFIQAKDAIDWAKFLQGKLHSPDYKIRTALLTPYQCDAKQVFVKANTCVVLVSPMLLEADNLDFWKKSKDRFHWRTVFLLLGVDKAELAGLGEDVCKNISGCRLLSVDGSPDTVKNTIVQLIEVYESSETPSRSSQKEFEDEKIYDYPPPPRQLNSVIKIMPSVVCEQNGREALIILEREAEQTIYLLQTNSQSSVPIKLDQIAGSAYLAKFPDDVSGELDFLVMTGDQTLNQITLTIQTRLEQLAALLEEELNPLTMLCNAMGLPSAKGSSTEELDSLIASRLKSVQYPQTLMALLSEDEHLSTEQESCRWPTLLHFAADFNLKKVCAILLQCPGTIHAACTENSEGLFPCQLAEKNGHLALQQSLLQYVEDMRLRSAADSGVMVESVPPPSPHSSVASPYYVNDSRFKNEVESMKDFDSEYVDMSGLSPKAADEALCGLSPVQKQKHFSTECPSPCKGSPDNRYLKPRSMSEGNIKTPYSRDNFGTRSTKSIKEEDDESQSSSPPELLPKTFRRAVGLVSHSSFRPTSTISEISGCDSEDHDFSDSCSDTVVPNRISCRSPLFTAQEADLEAFKIGEEKQQRLSGGSTDTSSIASQETPILRQKNSKRSKSVQDKISHFFKKIKPSRKQSSSDGELQTSLKTGKKSVVYSRQSAGSDPGQTSTFKKRSSTSSSEAECIRDSGAVCDEEKSPVIRRHRFKIPSSLAVGRKKSNTLPMNHRMSIRVEKAKQMEIRELPTLPPKTRRDSKETFVSFL